MGDDWLLVAIDSVERSVEALRDAMQSVSEVLGPATSQRASGVPLPEIAEGLLARGSSPRHLASESWHDYEHAVSTLRAVVIRHLVDDEGATFAQLANRMGVSRQLVRRLYDAAQDRRGPGSNSLG